MLRIGLVSDTHGKLAAPALAALVDSDMLLHAGDVGDPEILDRMEHVAPVHAVRGNVDHGPWAERLPLTQTLELEGCVLLLHHGHIPLPNELLEGVGVVVQGHSHRPDVRREGGRLYVNPGSAGPRRFKLPVSVAKLTVDGRRAQAETIDLNVA